MADLNKGSVPAWLSPQILNWWCYPEGLAQLDETAWRRAYEHHRHAEDVLRNRTDPMSRIDAISTLKRCLNQRLQHLQATYAFDKIALSNWPKRILDQMAELQMVRAFLLKHLTEVRNRIEHADAPPPSPSRCSELVDVVWYFLRSTDPFAKFQQDAFYFVEPTAGSDLDLSVRFEAHPARSWRIDVSGMLPPKWISTRKHAARIEINCTAFDRLDKHPHLEPGTIWFKGIVLGPSHAIASIIKQYFQLL